MLVFAPEETGQFGKTVAKHLDIELAPLEDRMFEDKEGKLRPLVSVHGEDVYVVQSLHGDEARSGHDKLCRLLFLIATLRDHGAARVTAVVPYMIYARKDRRTKPHDPLGLRYVAQLFEAVGCERVVAFDMHNLAAFENAFRCQTVPLNPRSVFADHLSERLAGRAVTVASPDPGGVKRAQLFRETLEARLKTEVGFAFIEKRRSAGVMTGGDSVGDLSGRTVIILDDIIASGGTVVQAARAFREKGADAVIAAAGHGLFTQGAADALVDPAIDQTIVTDTIPPFRLPEGVFHKHLSIISAAPLFAEAINRLNRDASLEELIWG